MTPCKKGKISRQDAKRWVDSQSQFLMKYNFFYVNSE